MSESGKTAIQKLTINILSEEQRSEITGVEMEDKNVYFGSDNQIYMTPKGNEIATATTAGKIKPSSDFEISEDGTLSIYKPVTVSITKVEPSVVEVGTYVRSVRLEWKQNKKSPYVAKLILSQAETKELTGEGKEAPIVNGIGWQSLYMSDSATCTITVDDGRNTATATANIYFRSYSYTRVGAGYAPLNSTGYVQQSPEDDFQKNGATFQYSAGDRIYFTSTYRNSKIQTNVLGQWADVNTTKITAEDGSDEFEFEQKNSAKRNVYLFATDEFAASGSAKYRIVKADKG